MKKLLLEGEVFRSNGELIFYGTDQTGFLWGGIPLETVIRTKMPEIGRATAKGTVKVGIAISMEE
jgi:hypothetical protein